MEDLGDDEDDDKNVGFDNSLMDEGGDTFSRENSNK